MRYIITGARAIGATIGGRLADTGRSVVLVARGAHADALKADELRLELPDRTIQQPIPMVTVAELEFAAGDVLILAVKSHQTESVLGELAAKPVGRASPGTSSPSSAPRTA